MFLMLSMSTFGSSFVTPFSWCKARIVHHYTNLAYPDPKNMKIERKGHNSSTLFTYPPNILHVVQDNIFNSQHAESKLKKIKSNQILEIDFTNSRRR